MTIYLDVVVFENMIMNYIILYATGMISKSEIHQGRIFLASLLGSAYVVTTYLSLVQGFLNIFLKILLSIAMIYLAFTPKSYRLLFKNLLLFYLTSFALGGCAFFLLYYLRPQDILIKNGVFIGTYPIKIAILGGILGAIVITVAFKFRKGRISKEDMFYEVEIFLGEKSTRVKAMLDTGNLLKEPITGTPVIIVEKQQMISILPEPIIQHLSGILQGKEMNFIEEEYVARFRVIPFSSLGKQNGMLLGFRPDHVLIYGEEQKNVRRNVIIGIYEKSLTKNGAYTALIGLDLIEGGDKDEFITSTKV